MGLINKDILKRMRHNDDLSLKEKLQEFDIVMNSFSNSLYMVIKNPDLIRCINLDIRELRKALKEGIALYYHGVGWVGYSYIFLDDFENDLTYKQNKTWDISKIYRRNTKGEVKVNNALDLKAVTNTKSLELLKGYFKLIFER